MEGGSHQTKSPVSQEGMFIVIKKGNKNKCWARGLEKGSGAQRTTLGGEGSATIMQQDEGGKRVTWITLVFGGLKRKKPWDFQEAEDR